MTIKAPTDGVVYYGRFVRGKWSGMETLADNLRRGGTVPKNTVVMTVVEPRPLWIRSSVSEADLEKVRPGMKATVRATALPDVLLAATVARVDAVPAGADSFEARLDVKLDEKARALAPGMTCSVKLVPFLDKAALVAPAKAVFTDELDEEKSYVYVTADGGKTSQKRYVTVGKRSDDRVEIVRGLAEGDAILLERPKDAAPAPGAKTGAGPKKG
jgi:multidrug efflux pump subunit AcrA (membrane-fusion protein)